MSDQLHERLDAKIGELRAAGRMITRIDASPADIERLFVEGGATPILLDCDPNRDTAWYGDVELQASPQPGVRLLVMGDEGLQNIEI
ncbi:hypothetical protein [Phenylobacterium sp.]|uniref:hypothetical protein n=1 Tax=Phenylobacterium sp. TaxID=1871053 RepID=UPI00289A280A|nr:hypothetical protein [Phenylobacterium sp.]